MFRSPWFCPVCQAFHGPHVDTCPKGELMPPTQPVERGCRVCGIGANGETMGYCCPRSDCPSGFTSCGGIADLVWSS
jgi:hypothetical protein